MDDWVGNEMARRTVLGLFVGGTATLLAGCGPSESRYRQKITIEVETPSGVKKGSSVIEVAFAAKSKVLEYIPGNSFSVHGEAVAVDVAPGKTLFALLSQPPERGSDTSWYQAMLFGDALRAGAISEPPLTLPGHGLDVHRVIGNSRAKLTLPPQLYPLLVTFTDLADPKSIERVAPADLAAAFGSGYVLRCIAVEVTDDAVTTGIEKRLATLGIEPDHGLDRRLGVTATPTLAQQLGYGDFVRL